MNRILACIFDLDGVIVFTDSYHFEAWRWLAVSNGWQFDHALNDQLRGVSRMASLQIILDYNGVTLSEEKMKRLAELKNDRYREALHGIDHSVLVEGAIDFISALRERGVRIGLGSSSKNAETVLDALDIAHLFDVIVTGNDIEHSKPHPQIFLLGAERLRVAPERCIVFEDAESGIEAARAAGMTAVGFGASDGFPGAHLVVERYSDIDIDALLS